MIRTVVGTLGLLILCFLLPGETVEAQNEQQKDQQEWERFRKEELAVYAKVFGKLPALSPDKLNQDFVNAFWYIRPQPESAFLDLGDKVLGRDFLNESDHWIAEFLRPEVRPKSVVKSPPEKYFLPRLRGNKRPFERSLLLHEWKTNKFRFTMYESGRGILLRVAPNDYKPGDTLTAKQLTALVREVLNIGYDTAGEGEQYFPDQDKAGYGSDDEFIKAYRLVEKVGPGDIFHPFRHLALALRPGVWKDRVFGFVSDRDICLVCMKCRTNLAPDDAFQQPDPLWLNRSLFEKDGKTLGAPLPKLVED